MSDTKLSDEVLLSPRDRHLFGPGRKRILSLDGGGVRGMLSLGILESLERTIEEIEGRPVRLGDWFDLIGGTSTGSIVATALALGQSVAEIRDVFEALAPRVFARSWRRIVGWQAKFDARRLMDELSAIVGERTLDSGDLVTGLCIVVKRLDTGSTWLLMNNSRSAFWDGPAGRRQQGNRSMHLAKIVRASTAAPSFFDPQPIDIVEGQAPGIFVDGGVTPHNNPALLLTMATIIPAYGLAWRAGPDNLLVVSVGTGTFRPTLTLEKARRSSAFMLALRSLSAMIAENQNQVLTLMSYFGETPTLWPINSEIGEVGSIEPPGGALFQFLRYDARLETAWLARELDEEVAAATIGSLQRMDEPRNLDVLKRIGREAGRRQIKAEHLAAFRRSGTSE